MVQVTAQVFREDELRKKHEKNILFLVFYHRPDHMIISKISPFNQALPAPRGCHTTTL